MNREIFLVQQYFTSVNEYRQREIDFCLQKNLDCNNINKIILLNEKKYDFSKFNDPHRKLVSVDDHEKRMTFYDVFNYCNNNLSNNTVVIVCNSDIFYVDRSLAIIKKNLKQNDFYCLSRWNYDCADINQSVLFKPSYSQDSWIGQIPIKINQKMDFSVGALWGCDNVIALLLRNEGYNVVNPCLSVKAYHVHAKQFYEPVFDTHKKLPPPYLFVRASGLDENIEPIIYDNSKKLILIQQYFVAKNDARRIEIDETFFKNASNKCIDKYIIMLEKKEDLEIVKNLLKLVDRQHIQYILFTRKACFSDYFNISCGDPELRDNVCVLANADIYFDDSIRELINLRKDQFAAIARHEILDNGSLELIQRPAHSQDVWAFVSPIPTQLEFNTDFPQGHWHCENRLSTEINSAGMILCNPCTTVRAIHNHRSNLGRENVPYEVCFTYGPVYGSVEPCKISCATSTYSKMKFTRKRCPDRCLCSACHGRRPGMNDQGYNPEIQYHNVQKLRFLQSLALDFDNKNVLEIKSATDVATWVIKRGGIVTSNEPNEICFNVANPYDITICFGFNMDQNIFKKITEISKIFIFETIGDIEYDQLSKDFKLDKIQYQCDPITCSKKDSDIIFYIFKQ